MRKMYLALVSLATLVAGCETSSTSEWPPKFRRFSARLYNVHVLKDLGSGSNASTLSHRYDKFYIRDTSWKYTHGSLLTFCESNVGYTGSLPFGSTIVRLSMQLQPAADNMFNLVFSGEEKTEAYAPSTNHGARLDNTTKISFTLGPVALWDADTLGLFWKGAKLDTLLRTLSYADYGSFTSNNSTSTHDIHAFALSPQTDSSAISIFLIK